MIISDKNIDQEIRSYKVDEIAQITRILESKTKKHTVSNNEELNNIKDQKAKIVNYDEYKEILFKTFWCSDEITIVAKEFYDGSFDLRFKDNNRTRYAAGLEFLFDCFRNIENFTKKKLIIKIITGLRPTFIKGQSSLPNDFKLHGKKNVDELYAFINEINKEFLLELKIIRWVPGDETEIGEGHGRRIYSDYGGFDTGYMPFEIHSKSLQTGEISYKDTSFYWIDSQIPWNKIGNGNLLASRTL